MKLEVGKKYRVKNGNAPWEVLAIDRCQTAWGICRGLVMSEHTAEPLAEWHDKPDPGEGWRLLEPDEVLQAGDEWCNEFGQWIASLQSGHRQLSSRHYRRRIAPQYVPYTWADREELRGRWFRRKTKESWQTNYERLVCFFYLIDGHFYVNSIRNDELLNEYEWLDGTPCGKKVV